MTQIRSPICTILGHVDHGKTKILDRIRGTAVQAGEAGGITQAIGASIIPLETIKKACGAMLLKLKLDFTIPGLLFIDTPGHAAFTNLRRRGGNLADIAILVIDIKEGMKQQTIEAVEILKQYKTPFIIAANKIDTIDGWQGKEIKPGEECKQAGILENIESQPERTKTILETKMYEIVGKLSALGFNSERFDRVDDYTKQIAIIPTSAKTGEGIAELLMVVTGLAQKYLEQCLKCDVEGNAKATVLEVKEEKGLGTTLDVIIYDGKLSIGDKIIIGGIDKPILTKVKALLQPMPLAEMREKKTKFKPVKEAYAATGVKISAPEIENVIAGMPLQSYKDDELNAIMTEIQKEVEEVLIETDKEGIIAKADALGSLEALVRLLREQGIKIRKAAIGEITKKDISDAESSYEKTPFDAVIVGFNVEVMKEAQEFLQGKNIKIITNNVIYKIIEDFEKWLEDVRKMQEQKELDTLVRPCKMQIMTGYVFRQSNPAIVGVDVIIGSIKNGTSVMNSSGKEVAMLKSMQREKESITKAEHGMQAAMALEGATVGRQINENDILFSSIPEEDFRQMRKLKQYLKKGEIEVLKEIAEIKRKEKAMWGI